MHLKRFDQKDFIDYLRNVRTGVFLLVILVAWLSVVPCCEAVHHCAYEGEACTDVSYSNEEGCTDELPCSPFYTCGTCTGCISPKTYPLVLEFTVGAVPTFVFEITPGLPRGILPLPLKPPRHFLQLA
ncbi:hypothetical protein [Cyclobacterium lianum]|uniref:hypothetical protein n=1 Tax=Cyclobacterium lianum TaxID=388280 RepID=UPI001160CBEC|nr:hypothetical protein [Cyclobacterium lianum]